jgi:hypothetical protein
MQVRLNMREPRRDPHRQHPMLRLLQSGGTLLAILLVGGCPAYANGQVCQDYEEVRKADHMSIGVSFDIPDPLIRQQFRHAMNFWASLLDMEWHNDETPGCAIKVSYGVPGIFDSDDIAQADDPDDGTFRGEIAFNADYSMTPQDAYLVCVHEIGHLLGLDHNPHPASVMHAVGLDGAQKLEVADISALSARHRLRWGNDAGQQLAFELPVGAAMDDLFSPPAEQTLPRLSDRQAPHTEQYPNRASRVTRHSYAPRYVLNETLRRSQESNL